MTSHGSHDGSASATFCRFVRTTQAQADVEDDGHASQDPFSCRLLGAELCNEHEVWPLSQVKSNFDS